MLKQANNFHDDAVNEQLRYAGMIETIRIRRLGYPIRYVFKEFYQRFKCLVHSQHHSTGGFEERIVGMLPHINLAPGQSQKGLTKVFLKQEASNILEDRRAMKLGEVILIAQCWYRMIALRKQFKERRNAALTLETWFRARSARRNFFEDRDAARKIQNSFRVAKAVLQKKALLEKKRKEEEEIRRKKEEERQKKIAAGKMTQAEAVAEAEREAKMEMEDLLEKMDSLHFGVSNPLSASRKIQYLEFRSIMLPLPSAASIRTIIELVRTSMSETNTELELLSLG